MRDGFPGIPSSVDAAFLWGGNNRIYFFKGSEYWKFDHTSSAHVRNDLYPKDVRQWWHLPGDMDAALQWENGKTYFFRDGSYWRFNDQRFMVDSGSPPFPRDAQDWLFGCYDSNQVQVGEFEEQLVSERTISSNPFLNEETQEDFGG